mmetsp:Transcript_49364/g.139792  ORF Transcript_49364/g.139792 Transcript_49364/m.139792 type:complete len:94 (-) Transcript_49364:1148-1429(-)
MSERELAQHRRVLNVPFGADSELLKAAYKKQSLKAHPDQGGSEAAFQRVAEAYEALTQAAHEERWGTSSSAYGQHVSGQPKLLTENGNGAEQR